MLVFFCFWTAMGAYVLFENGDDSERRQCQSLVGMVFGHKFNSNTWDYTGQVTDFCTRCGYKP